MLPMIYGDSELAEQVGADPYAADIPELHKAMFRFTEKFVKAPWSYEPGDLDQLRTLGLTDVDIVQWAQIACTQSWFVMSADGGGISLEGEAETGSVLKRSRDDYESRPAYQPSPAPATAQPANNVSWVGSDTSSPAFGEVRDWAVERYGFVPNLLTAVSLFGDMYPRQQLALELLERPQSDSLSPELHALARARASLLNASTYSEHTVRALIPDQAVFHRLRAEELGDGWEPQERTVLDFTTKLVRNSYKTTEADAERFRDSGLDDAAYVDVLNTVAIQVSLDRLAACLGVAADPSAIVPLKAADGVRA